MDFQSRFNRIEQEIRDLKTAQNKPSTIKPYVMATPTTTTPTNYTITFADDGSGFNPIVLIIGAGNNGWLGQFDATTNTQPLTTTATGSYTITVISNRQILSIA